MAKKKKPVIAYTAKPRSGVNAEFSELVILARSKKKVFQSIERNLGIIKADLKLRLSTPGEVKKYFDRLQSKGLLSKTNLVRVPVESNKSSLPKKPETESGIVDNPKS